MRSFMFASIATLLAITADRSLYIVKPLRYSQIVTHRRVFLAVSGIWITACFVFSLQYIHSRSYGTDVRVWHVADRYLVTTIKHWYMSFAN